VLFTTGELEIEAPDQRDVSIRKMEKALRTMQKAETEVTRVLEMFVRYAERIRACGDARTDSILEDAIRLAEDSGVELEEALHSTFDWEAERQRRA